LEYIYFSCRSKGRPSDVNCDTLEGCPAAVLVHFWFWNLSWGTGVTLVTPPLDVAPGMKRIVMLPELVKGLVSFNMSSGCSSVHLRQYFVQCAGRGGMMGLLLSVGRLPLTPQDAVSHGERFTLGPILLIGWPRSLISPSLGVVQSHSPTLVAQRQCLPTAPFSRLLSPIINSGSKNYKPPWAACALFNLLAVKALF
jgi:hypothetical protein